MSDRGVPQSFDLTAGEAFVLTLTADQDIAGATVSFWVVGDPDFSAHPNTLVLSTGGGTAVGIVTTSPELQVIVADEDTELLLGTYRYEVGIEDIDGNKSKAAYGFLTFEAQVEQ